MDGAGSYSVAHRAGLLPTELTGMRGWILLRSPHQGRGSPPAPTPTKQGPRRMSWVLLVALGGRPAPEIGWRLLTGVDLRGMAAVGDPRFARLPAPYPAPPPHRKWRIVVDCKTVVGLCSAGQERIRSEDLGPVGGHASQTAVLQIFNGWTLHPPPPSTMGC